ncbi:quinone oxidoreductase family protein [Pseudomonas chlororaphis]|uniref:Zinc-containing alcohol dehydrogenase superfamily protein n=1 Tax=Pseudomonas chlororaphis TaxID=587753 RepID=A0AAX3G4D7_9PSED|nr:zinc-binding alcohol dehydrogenase family protein [Pseudomonas chlororaphis]AZC36648.1 Putative oxidoreductase [Pseudomonas chlororaphis subsp. piscium]AZC43193.1 Putative oxidoreductase [Pseudomonas chlororaphis subsp. piscium]AZC49879.1 Putative oxidoreductase [Pseudomonas chlororaphis subsp. piscium]WDG75075.1 zinc-binding alcohol dehydrogenase family protein [Pseudomonas chlororaphis]WDH27289.1 zinc-binding alcohol dehydrogenase family protein [Pseudomonas chlororaphis]
MHALQFSKTGDLSSLHYVEVPTPVPAADQVLVQIKAAGLNPSDVKNVLGRFPYTTLPRIPGRDFAGVVVDGPQELVGQEVWGTGKELGFYADGSHAQYVVLSAKGVAHKPAHLSFAQAASLGVPYTTAWDALERSGVGAGTPLLVIGGGAVGSAALALAKIRGARLLAAARRPEQVKALQAQGFETVQLDQPENLGAQVNAVFAGGAEVIFDTTGFWLPASVAALAPFGRIAIIAAPVDGHVQLPALGLYRKGGSVVGINSLLYGVQACAAMLEQFGRFFDEGLLPLPQGLFEAPLEQGVERYHEVNRGSGEKVILLP